MNDAERQIWAASYAAAYLSIVEVFKPDPYGQPVDDQRAKWEFNAAIDAVEHAGKAVMNLRSVSVDMMQAETTRHAFALYREAVKP